jgi:hypothetical protein
MGYAGGGILAFNGEDNRQLVTQEDFERLVTGKGLPLTKEQKEKLENTPSVFKNFGRSQRAVAAEGAQKNAMQEAIANAPRTTPSQADVQDIQGSSQGPQTVLMSAPPAPPPPPPAVSGAPVDRGVAAATGMKSLEEQMREQERLMGPNTANEGLNAKIAERLAGMSKREKQDELAAIRNAFIKFGTEASPGGIGVAALKGIGSYGDASDAAKKAREGMDLELTKMQADIKKGERAEKRGNLDAAAKAYESAENRQLKFAEMQNQLKVAGIQASRASDFEKQYEAFKNDPAKFEQFRRSLTAQDDTARLNAYVKADAALGGNTKYLQLINSKKPEDQAKAEKMRSDKIAEYLGALGVSQAPTASAAPQIGTDGTVNIPGKGTFKQLPNGNYVKI